MSIEIIHGDCLEVLRGMTDASVDAVVTDPPYELGFMGRKWDASGIAYSVDLWREALRVLKPGGHLLGFGGTRTYHRMACAIEDAGFDIRDSMHWIYGQGFPKSHNLPGGLGTALKPAHEPIVVARKPLCGTVAANVQEYGTGAINIDACRVDGTPRTTHVDGNRRVSDSSESLGGGFRMRPHQATAAPTGRWPANVLLTHSSECRRVGERKVKGMNVPGIDRGSALGQMNDDAWQAKERVPQSYTDADGTETVPAFECAPDCPVRMLDKQSGELTSNGQRQPYETKPNAVYGDLAGRVCPPRETDTGGASRFFHNFTHDPFVYQAKASKRDRGEGNKHPTVKPTALMRHLVRLVTPPGGIVLDPFAGSGTTLVAAQNEGFSAIGIERESEYVEIIKARIAKSQEAA